MGEKVNSNVDDRTDFERDKDMVFDDPNSPVQKASPMKLRVKK